MARVSPLRESSIGIGCAVGINSIRAVVFLIGFAVFASQIGADLSTNTYAIPDLDGLDVLANLNRFADDFVSDADRHDSVAPAAIDCVNVRTAPIGQRN